MWHMGTWNDPLVTRGGDTRSGRSCTVPALRVRNRGYDTLHTNRGGGAASFLDHRGTWNP
jgi:hypothetical protein